MNENYKLIGVRGPKLNDDGIIQIHLNCQALSPVEFINWHGTITWDDDREFKLKVSLKEVI